MSNREERRPMLHGFRNTELGSYYLIEYYNSLGLHHGWIRDWELGPDEPQIESKRYANRAEVNAALEKAGLGISDVYGKEPTWRIVRVSEEVVT